MSYKMLKALYTFISYFIIYLPDTRRHFYEAVKKTMYLKPHQLCKKTKSEDKVQAPAGYTFVIYNFPMSAQKTCFIKFYLFKQMRNIMKILFLPLNGILKNAIRFDFLHRQYMKNISEMGDFVHLDEKGNDVFLFYKKRSSWESVK